MRDEDETEWHRLWEAIAPRLLAFLRAFGSLGPADRQDIVQHVFLKAWKVRERLEPGSRLPAWFFRVARNQALDALKARARELGRFPRPAPHEDGSEIEAPGRFPGPEEAALDMEKAAFMETFLAALSDAEREICHLHYAEGLAYPEIARVTGSPTGTVKWRASVVREKLEAAYRKEFGE